MSDKSETFKDAFKNPLTEGVYNWGHGPVRVYGSDISGWEAKPYDNENAITIQNQAQASCLHPIDIEVELKDLRAKVSFLEKFSPNQPKSKELGCASLNT
jgi:hypothetical protein